MPDRCEPLFTILKADVQDGDRLIVRIPDFLEAAAVEAIKSSVREWAGCQVAVLVLHGEASLEIDRYDDRSRDERRPRATADGLSPTVMLPPAQQAPGPRLVESDVIHITCAKCGKPMHPNHMRGTVCIMCLAASGVGDNLRGGDPKICRVCGRPFVPETPAAARDLVCSICEANREATQGGAT